MVRTTFEKVLFGVVVAVCKRVVCAEAVDDDEVRKVMALNGGLICRAARAGS